MEYVHDTCARLCGLVQCGVRNVCERNALLCLTQRCQTVQSAYVCAEERRSDLEALVNNMSVRPRAISAVVSLVALLSLVQGAHAARISTQNASPFYIAYISIGTGTTVTYETSACSASTNPVLHLLRIDSNGVPTQVAFNDDYAGLGVNARVAYTNFSATTTFMLIMRSASSTTEGSCAVSKNGLSFEPTAPVGGRRISASSLTQGPNNRLHTTHVIGGSVTHAVLAFAPNYSTIVAMGLGNSPGGAANMLLGGAESDYLVGTPRIRNGGTLLPQPEVGNVRVLINDYTVDPDGDGLGSGLEGELGTCAATTGCLFRAVSGKDSDRDGLSDGDEVFGVGGVLPGGVDDLPLARWGASPIHKDVFVEVDYVNTLGTLPPGTNPFAWLRAHPNDATVYNGTVEGWVSSVRAPFLTGPTNHLQNPDGNPGVNVHLDIGVKPNSRLDEGSFGDYGASSSYALEPDWMLTLNAPISGSIQVSINGVLSAPQNVTGASALQMVGVIINMVNSVNQGVVWRSTAMDPVTGKYVIRFRASPVGVPFSPSLLRPAGFESAVVEQRITSPRISYDDNSGQVNTKRRGKFRYGVITSLGQGGEAVGLGFVTGMPPVSSFAHELGHTLGIQHWGHDQWGNGYDNDCLPHYLSLMTYGVPVSTFSTATTTLPLNPAAAVENTPLGASFTYSTLTNAPWNYAVSGTRVDWNRDLLASSTNDQWRAPAMSLYNVGCKAYSQERRKIDIGTTPVVGAVDLVRGGSRLYAFWSEGPVIRYRFATLGAIGNKSCTGNSDPYTGADCLTWEPSNSTHSINVNGDHQGVSVSVFGGELYVAYRTSGFRIQVMRFTMLAGGTLSINNIWDLSTVDAFNQTSATPELVQLHDTASNGALGLMYLDLNGRYRLKRFVAAAWGPTNGESLMNPSGIFITGSYGPAAKAWPDVDVPWNPNERRTVAILPATNGAMRVYVLRADGFWESVENTGFDTSRKPFIEFRSMRLSTGATQPNFDGHFLLGWHYNEGLVNASVAVMQFSTRVSRTIMPNGSPNLGSLAVGDLLINAWAADQASTSGALYSDSTIDNVFGLVALDVPGQVGVWFFPHADGSPNHAYSVNSDFKIMEDGICALLSTAGGQPCGTINVLD